MNPAQIRKHMEVLSADGEHVGTVDHMEGADRIKLARGDAAAHGGHHHYIPASWVDRIDEHVHLSKPADYVAANWEHGAA